MKKKELKLEVTYPSTHLPNVLPTCLGIHGYVVGSAEVWTRQQFLQNVNLLKVRLRNWIPSPTCAPETSVAFDNAVKNLIIATLLEAHAYVQAQKRGKV